MKTNIRKLISTLCLLTTLAAQTATGFYDPNLQRWLTPDPIGEAGGINLYAFNNNAPVNWLDPDGETPTLLTGGIGFVAGGVIGGGVAWWRGGNIWDGATEGAVVGGVAELTGGLAGGTAARFLAGRGINAVAVGVGSGAVGGMAGDVAAQTAEMVMGDRCRFNGVRTVTSGVLGAGIGGIAGKMLAAKATPTVFRQGTFPDPATGWKGNFVKGQQWATDNPVTTHNFAQKYGLPTQNTGKPDWVVGGRVQGTYTTRTAPPSHNNPLNKGGAKEVLPQNPNNVWLDWFHMPD